jgi:formamidopyrimidine-DNA glycosylase
VGQRVASIDVRLPKLLRDSPLPDLSALHGAHLRRAGRRAKVLILDFDNDLSLLIHLKLAGQWAIHRATGGRLVAGHPVPDPAGPLPHKTTHVIFRFESGDVAFFNDVRQFGWIRLLPSTDVDAALQVFGFGPEGTESLDIRALAPTFGRRGVPVKALLLDQTFIAGLGNIYVDEVLFRARVHPETPANQVSAIKRRRILEAVPRVLEAGIAQGGARIIRQRAYPVDGFPAVHGREGEPCVACGTTIVKTRVAGRGTYLCPRCQKRPRSLAAVHSVRDAEEVAPPS